MIDFLNSLPIWGWGWQQYFFAINYLLGVPLLGAGIVFNKTIAEKGIATVIFLYSLIGLYALMSYGFFS